MVLFLVGSGIIFAFATISLVMLFRKKHDMIYVTVMLYLTALALALIAFTTG